MEDEPGVVVRNAQEAAEALVRAVGLAFGELTVKVSDEGVQIVRATRTLKREDLLGLKVEAG